MYDKALEEKYCSKFQDRYLQRLTSRSRDFTSSPAGKLEHLYAVDCIGENLKNIDITGGSFYSLSASGLEKAKGMRD